MSLQVALTTPHCPTNYLIVLVPGYLDATVYSLLELSERFFLTSLCRGKLKFVADRRRFKFELVSGTRHLPLGLAALRYIKRDATLS